MEQNNEKIYVFDDCEVRLTGRKAERRRSSTVRGSKDIIDVLYEIAPLNDHFNDWKKWVKMSDLFIIVDGEAR